MESSKIIRHCGTALDIARVKSMQVIQIEDGDHLLVFELIDRIEYVFNPNTSLWEIEPFSDSVILRYPCFETANAYLEEWAEIWREYAEAPGSHCNN